MLMPHKKKNTNVLFLKATVALKPLLIRGYWSIIFRDNVLVFVLFLLLNQSAQASYIVGPIIKKSISILLYDK